MAAAAGEPVSSVASSGATSQSEYFLMETASVAAAGGTVGGAEVAENDRHFRIDPVGMHVVGNLGQGLGVVHHLVSGLVERSVAGRLADLQQVQPAGAADQHMHDHHTRHMPM